MRGGKGARREEPNLAFCGHGAALCPLCLRVPSCGDSKPAVVKGMGVWEEVWEAAGTNPSSPPPQACYGILKVPIGSWLCRTCALGVQPKCLLCPKRGGALKPTRSGTKWVHVSCALWIPEVRGFPASSWQAEGARPCLPGLSPGCLLTAQVLSPAARSELCV